MTKASLFPAMAAALLLAVAPEAFAQSSTRYSPPPAVALSSDLAGPWVLQLSNRPPARGRYSVEIAAPKVRAAPPKLRQPVHLFTPPAAESPRRRTDLPRATSVPALPAKKKPEFDPRFEMQMVEYQTDHKPGTIIIDTTERFLYLVEANGQARRYGVGVGREGFEWSGTNTISRKAEWPGWTPPPEMIARERKRGKILPAHMPGGPENPLGARALYLGDTLYRIHGTNQPWSIGRAVSSGCIRMRNEDVIDLYERVKIGAKVVVS